jgi:hypothetical protein
MRRRYLWLAYLTQAQSKLAAPKGAVAQLSFLSEWMNSWIVTFFFSRWVDPGTRSGRGEEAGRKKLHALSRIQTASSLKKSRRLVEERI